MKSIVQFSEIFLVSGKKKCVKTEASKQETE